MTAPPTCVACDKYAAERRGERIRYMFQFQPAGDDPGFGVMFDVTIARELAFSRLESWRTENEAALRRGERPQLAPLERMDPEDLGRWLHTYALDVDPAHALGHIPPTAADVPGLVVEVWPGVDPGRPRRVFWGCWATRRCHVKRC